MKRLYDETRDLAEAASFARDPERFDEVLARALSALQPVVPFDLAVLYELEGRALVPRSKEGRLTERLPEGRTLSLDEFPTMERALELRRPIAVLEHQHAGSEGDPYDGVLDLPPGHSCMVVPLAAGDRDLGVLTLDRTVCEPYSDSLVELADVFGRLLSTALVFGRQAQALDRLRRRYAEAARQRAEDRGSAPARLEASASPAMRRVVAQAKQVAASELPILIEGETGTGKEVLAEAVHFWSRRADRPFVRLNCAALPDNLVESELFGHVRGAFSGASADRTGRFRTANGGTLLLDEVGDTPAHVQAKLLRVLQEGTFEPVGSDRTVRVDVRVISATHVPLEAAVRDGRFREDLYYRLAAVRLDVPPLRDRPEDILPLARGILGEERSLAPDAEAALLSSPWPGNVRELLHNLERAVALSDPAGDGVIRADDLVVPVRSAPPGGVAELAPWAVMERRLLEAALRHTGGKIYGPGGAAELLELKPTTLISKLKKAGLR